MAIKTPTLAEIFVSQGHLDQAVALYEELVANRPEDDAMRERLALLRQQWAEMQTAMARKSRIKTLRNLLSRVRTRRRCY
jgi:hypothetical protein